MASHLMLNVQRDDDMKASLLNYQLQLQQVEAALDSVNQENGMRMKTEEEDKNYDELLKLKTDLETVIKLTKDLMHEEEQRDGGGELGTNSNEEVFKSGDIVLAPWSEDGLYYRAVVEDITSDGQCNVCFLKNEIKSKPSSFNEVCLLNLLKPIAGGSSLNPNKNKNYVMNDDSNDKRKLKLPKKDMVSTHPASETKAKRFLLQQQRENLKKRQLKRAQRRKELEEEREKDKNKWQQFHQKIMNKKHVHLSAINKKQSIFASPSTIEGKVGVGTCGIGGQPMTEYCVSQSHKRGSASLAAASTGVSLPSSSSTSSSSSITTSTSSSRHPPKYK